MGHIVAWFGKVIVGICENPNTEMGINPIFLVIGGVIGWNFGADISHHSHFVEFLFAVVGVVLGPIVIPLLMGLTIYGLILLIVVVIGGGFLQWLFS